MANSKVTPFEIFLQGIGLFAENFLSFMKYMWFPVFGQVIGIVLCFGLVYAFTQNLETLRDEFLFLEDSGAALITVYALALPGIIIFMKAFWDYLVAYGAINSMTENMLKSGKLYDFKAHTQVVTRRSMSFIGIWLIFGLYNILAASPFLVVILGIFFIYIILVFQVFTFEPKLSPLSCFKRSFTLVKGNFWRTLALSIFIGTLCYIFIPQIIGFACKTVNLIPTIADWILGWVQQFPLENLNTKLEAFKIAKTDHTDIAIMLVASTISMIIVGLTLPIRSICWTLWYKELVKETDKKSEKKKKNV